MDLGLGTRLGQGRHLQSVGAAPALALYYLPGMRDDNSGARMYSIAGAGARSHLYDTTTSNRRLLNRELSGVTIF